MFTFICTRKKIFLSLSSHWTLWTLLILVVSRTHVIMNLVNMTSLATSLPVAQWLERPTGVREVMCWFPSGTQIFFFVPRLWHVDYSIFIISYPSLNLPSFLLILHSAFDIANPSDVLDACHNEPINVTSLATGLSVAQPLEHSTGTVYTKGHRFGSQIFLRLALVI